MSNIMKVVISLMFGWIIIVSGITLYDTMKPDIQTSVVEIISTIIDSADYETPQSQALGSGFFIADNLIVTNYHVIQNNTSLVVYGRNNPTPFPAKVLSYSEEADLALLEIIDWQKFKARNDYRILKWSSRAPEVADNVTAIGHPAGLTWTVSKGYISALYRDGPKERPKLRYIQVTSDIFPGNSGGPILNDHYEVVGISDFIETLQNGAGSLKFGIDGRQAQKVIADLLRNKQVDWPLAGIMYNFDIGKNAYVIRKILPGSGASMAGLQEGDIIEKFSTHDLHYPVEMSISQLSFIASLMNTGDKITFDIKRDNTKQKVIVMLSRDITKIIQPPQVEFFP